MLVLLMLLHAAPAGADSLSDAKARRDADRAKRAKLAAKIDALKASDEQLDAAVATLDRNVNAQASDTEAAMQAAQAASAILRSSEARLDDINRRLDQVRARAAGAAIHAYIHPSGSVLMGLVRAHDLSEASHRQALLTHVVSTDQGALDELRGLRKDETAGREALADAQDLTTSRQRDATSRLRALQAARSEQQRMRAALDDRIAEYTTEVDALAKDEAAVTEVIRAKEAAAGSAAMGAVSGAGLIWPVRGPITSGFGMRWGRMHQGIDISAGYGTPIHAAKAGTVIFAGSMGGYGNAVIISHGGGFSTLYGHQSRIAVSDGQTVSQGQVIGYVGCTGHCTGPHLHFETRVNGAAQNPRSYL